MRPWHIYLACIYTLHFVFCRHCKVACVLRCIFRNFCWTLVIVSSTSRCVPWRTHFPGTVSRRLFFWMQLKKGSSPGGDLPRRLGRVLLSFENQGTRFGSTSISAAYLHPSPFRWPSLFAPDSFVRFYCADSLSSLLNAKKNLHPAASRES